MGGSITGSADVAIIAAMVTPALLLVASASLVASALTRMGRVVDRARALAALTQATPLPAGVSPSTLVNWLERHARRARQVQRCVALLYGAIVVFVACCISIALERTLGAFTWLPAAIAVAGTLPMLGGAILMVLETGLSASQIDEEIALSIARTRALAVPETPGQPDSSALTRN